jgi:hypothetical protein
MKTLRMIGWMGFTLCAGTLSSQAHGCGYGYGCFPFWPLLSFGLGFGLGAATAHSQPAQYTYVYPSYAAYPSSGYTSYAPAQPVYAQTYRPAQPTYAQNSQPRTVRTVAAVSQRPTVTAMARPQSSPAWAPSTQGAGHWVQDPEPYSYSPLAATRKTEPASMPATETVSISQAPGSVRLVVVSR